MVSDAGVDAEPPVDNGVDVPGTGALADTVLDVDGVVIEPTQTDRPSGTTAEPTDLDRPEAGANPEEQPGTPEAPGAPRSQPPAGAFGGLDSLPPILASRYPDAEFVAAGSQARVYRAPDPQRGVVAIRVAYRGVHDQVNQLGFLDIRHRSVAQVHEVGEEDGQTFQVMEWVDGRPLERAHVLGSDGEVDPGRLVELVRQLHGALTAFEESRHAHRDVKPGNILIEHGMAPDDTLRAVLIDFGLVHPSAHTIVQHPERNFTPGYAAPEAFFNRSGLAFDWWSLGVVLAEIIQGVHPFGRSREDVELNVAFASADISLVEDPRWELLLRGLLTPDPRYRWRSREVGAWLDGGSPAVVAPSLYAALLDQRMDLADPVGPMPPGEPSTSTPQVGDPPSGGDSANPSAPSSIRGAVAAAPPVPPLVFLGRDYRRDPRRLADALGSNWDDAARLIGSPAARSELLRWVAQFHDLGLSAAVEGAGGPDSTLDRDLVRVIGALYRTQAKGSRGLGARWYRGAQLHDHQVHRIIDEGLVDVEELVPAVEGDAADERARPGEFQSEALRRAVALADGDLVWVANWSGRGTSTEALARNHEAGCGFVERRTALLDRGEREDWELTLWRLRLLHALSEPAASAALRSRARDAVRARPDLWPLVGGGTGAAHHLTASILAARTTPPSLWQRIRLWFRHRADRPASRGRAASDGQRHNGWSRG